MLQDKLNEFCDAVSVAAVAGTTLVGDQIDLLAAGNFGNGVDIYLVISVDTAIVTGGSAGTLKFHLASDDSASISTTTSTIHLSTPAYVTDDSPTIPAGTILVAQKLPPGLTGWTASNRDYERYLGILSEVITTTITAGKINAYLTADVPGQFKSYPNATN